MIPALLASALVAADAATPHDLAFFQGSWTCQGHFVPSMKPVASTMVFSLDPETGATIKHLADKPPGGYGATETWACAGRRPTAGRQVFSHGIAPAARVSPRKNSSTGACPMVGCRSTGRPRAQASLWCSATR